MKEVHQFVDIMLYYLIDIKLNLIYKILLISVNFKKIVR